MKALGQSLDVPFKFSGDPDVALLFLVGHARNVVGLTWRTIIPMGYTRAHWASPYGVPSYPVGIPWERGVEPSSSNVTAEQLP